MFALADRDDLVLVDARSGKRTLLVSHKIEHASFGLLNERGDIVIGGQSELAALRGQWMYFHTDLGTHKGNGLAGVNVNNGRTAREVRISNLDERFVTDEALGLIFTASGNRIFAHEPR